MIRRPLLLILLAVLAVALAGLLAIGAFPPEIRTVPVERTIPAERFGTR